MPGQQGAPDSGQYLPNGQFMGTVNPNTYSQYGVLPPATQQGIGSGSPLNGQAGYVGSKAGAALSGVQGGFNFEQQVTGSKRANADYEKTQALQRTMARQQYEQTLSTPAPDPTDPMYSQKMQDREVATKSLAQLAQPQGFGGFLSTLGTGIQKLGHQVAPGVIPSPGGPQPVANGATPLPNTGQAGGAPPQQGALPTGAYANGGPVTAFSPSSTPQPATPAGYDEGGPVPQQAAPQGAALPPPPQMGGPPQGAPPQGAAPAQGAPPQQPAPQAPPGMPGNPGLPNNPLAALPPQAQDPSGPFNKFYQGLLDASLTDKGEPAGREPVPSAIANPNVAIQSTASNPAATKGIPEDSPEESNTPTHSLSSGWYDHQDFLAHQAAAQAAQSGHDPGAVYNAMTNMTTSFLQSHIMREASAAAVAVQAGDMPAVEKALKNMYYYVPDGNELKTQTIGGQLVYQNPIFPYLDGHGQPTAQGGPGATPNMQPVDLAHVSMLARAAADPMEIGSLIQNARIAAQEQQTKALTAQAGMVSAQGTLARGQGIAQNAANEAARVPSQNYEAIAHAQYWLQANQARIAAAGGKGDPLAQKAGMEASKLVTDQAQGQQVTEPSMIPDPKRPGTMIPSMSPNAGRTTRDPTKLPAWARGKNADQIASISGLAGELAAANYRTKSAQDAVNLAGAIYNHQGSTHKGPDGKPVSDVKFSPDHTQGWVWTGQNWQNFSLSAKTGGNLASGVVDNDGPAPQAGAANQDPSGDNPYDPDPEESNGLGGNPYAATPEEDNAPAQ